MRKLLFVLTLAALWPGRLPASDQQFTFALPEMEGRISLGIFDSQDRLVRTLAIGAAVGDFKIGLNGLITTWDGRDDAGREQPAGKYQARGFVVGEGLQVQGEAFHFNDWVEDENSPRLVRIDDFCLVPDGFLVLGRVQGDSPFGASLLYFGRDGALRWHSALSFKIRQRFAGSLVHTPARFQTNGPKPKGGDIVVFPALQPPVDSPHMVAAGQKFSVVVGGKNLFVVSLADGSLVNSEETLGLPASALAVSGDEALVVSAGGISRISLPNLEVKQLDQIPSPFVTFAADSARQIGGTRDAEAVWISLGQAWEKVDIGLSPRSVSLGLSQTFWVTGESAEMGGSFAGQFDQKGEFLRAYRDGFVSGKVAASTETEEIAVLEEDGSTQRLRKLEFSGKKDDASSEWTITFEKSLTPCQDFGLVDGRLVPSGGGNPAPPLFSVSLDGGGLTAVPPKLKLQVVVDGKNGIWLQTNDGLPLLKIAELPGVSRIVLADAPEADSKRIYAGDGAVVAEYLLTGLGHIAEIEAGEIEIP